MKKIVLSLFFLFFATQINAALPTTAAEFGVNLPMFPGGFEFKAAAIFMKGSTSQLDYALIYPDALLTTHGYYENEDPNVDFAYQFMAGYKFRCSANDIRATYTDFFNSGTAQIEDRGLILPGINDAVVLVPAGIVDLITLQFPGQLFMFPNTVVLEPAVLPVTGRIIEADAKNEFRLIAIDIDLGQHIDIDTFIRIRWLAGLRYSLVRNKFDTNFVFTDFTTSETQTITLASGGVPLALVTTTLNLASASPAEFFIRQSSHFNGIGPRLGGEGSFHLGGGFGITGSLTGALLVGQQESALAKGFASDLLMNVASVDLTVTPLVDDPSIFIGDINLARGTLVTSPASINNANFQYDATLRIVPNLEAKIGLNYTHQFKNCRNLTLEAGYYVNHYFNAIDRLSVLGVDEPALAPRNTMDAGFHGPYVSLEFNI